MKIIAKNLFSLYYTRHFNIRLVYFLVSSHFADFVLFFFFAFLCSFFPYFLFLFSFSLLFLWVASVNTNLFICSLFEKFSTIFLKNPNSFFFRSLLSYTLLWFLPSSGSQNITSSFHSIFFLPKIFHFACLYAFHRVILLFGKIFH